MLIEVQCTSCQMKYHADEKVAGKRVRCKHCGSAFDVPALPRGSESSDLVEGFGSSEEAPDGSPTIMRHETSGLRPDWADARLERNGGAPPSVLDLAGDARGPSFRANLPLEYPLADVVDRFGPIVLTLLGLGWVTLLSLTADDAPRAWAGPARALVVLAIFSLLTFPIGLASVRRAMRAVKVELPGGEKLRAFGSFAIGFALAYAMWRGGGIGGLIFGTILGAGTAGGAIWVLFRLRSEEAPLAFAYVAGGLGTGMAGLVLAMVGLNAVIWAGMHSAGVAHTLGNSPLGEQFSWKIDRSEGSQSPESDVISASPAVGRDPAGTTAPPSGEGTIAANPPAHVPVPGAGARLGDAPIGPQDGTARPTPPVPVGPDEVDTAGGSIFATVPTTRSRGSAPRVDRHGMPNRPDVYAPPRVPDPVPPAPNRGTRAAVEWGSPVIAEMRTTDLGPGSGILLPPVGGSSLGVVRELSATEDVIERWTTAPAVKALEQARFSHSARARGERYLLSPDGDLLVRMVDFPKVGAQVWSFSQNRVIQTIEMGTPTLLGFIDESRFAAYRHEQSGGREVTGIALYDAKTGKPSRGVRTPVIADVGAGNPVFSRDGRLLAVVAPSPRNEEPQILVFDLIAPGPLELVNPMRVLRVNAGRWLPLVGVAFSADGSRLAALFEENNNALLTGWKFTEPKPIFEHVYPAGLLPAAAGQARAAGYAGQALDWLENGETLLGYGRALVDAASGKLLIDLQPPDLASHRIVDATTIQLIQQNPWRITIAKLDAKKVAALKN